MRVFVGIPIAKKLKKEISRFLAQFSSTNFQFSNKSQIPNSKIRWLKPENVHITLVPPWEMNYEAGSKNYELLEQQLRLASSQAKKFVIRFTKVELGPDKYRPRMFWATGKAPEELVNLRKNIEKHLSFVNIIDGRHLSKQGFRMHCTLARLKQTQNAESRTRNDLYRPAPQCQAAVLGTLTNLGEDLDIRIDWKMEVDRFVLYESRLLPGGSEYRVIEEFKLS